MPVAELNRKSEIGNHKSEEVVVSVRGLTKVFKDFWNRPKARAVDNVDFEVRRGEVFGLLGPNGSGKSTTVKLLLGLLNPTKGHIEVFGHSPRHVQTKSRIGYLPEESYLYRYLNSRETLDFFGNLFHLSKAERDNRAEQLLEMVGLGKTQTRAVGEFSKGMQRRIGLAHTQFADATCGTIRLKLLKLGALVRISVRRIKVAMASACPWQDAFALAHARLRNAAA